MQINGLDLGATKTPRWVREQPAAVIARGEELWWTNNEVTLRGAPPDGVPIVPRAIVVPADWGPTGYGDQIYPGVLRPDGTGTFLDRGGETVAHVNARALRYVERWVGGELVWVKYPPAEREGEMREQYLCGYAPYLEMPASIEVMGMHFHLPGAGQDPEPIGGGPQEPTRAFYLVAFLPPLEHNEQYDVGQFDLAILPRMSGIAVGTTVEEG